MNQPYKLKGNVTQVTTLCNHCKTPLRDSFYKGDKQVAHKVLMHEPVVNVGDGEHKCKECYKHGVKKYWSFDLNVI